MICTFSNQRGSECGREGGVTEVVYLIYETSIDRPQRGGDAQSKNGVFARDTVSVRMLILVFRGGDIGI